MPSLSVSLILDNQLIINHSLSFNNISNELKVVTYFSTDLSRDFCFPTSLRTSVKEGVAGSATLCSFISGSLPDLSEGLGCLKEPGAGGGGALGAGGGGALGAGGALAGVLAAAGCICDSAMLAIISFKLASSLSRAATRSSATSLVLVTTEILSSPLSRSSPWELVRLLRRGGFSSHRWMKSLG